MISGSYSIFIKAYSHKAIISDVDVPVLTVTYPAKQIKYPLRSASDISIHPVFRSGTYQT